MPLSALTDYGTSLAERRIIPPLGWSVVKAPFGLVIDLHGELCEVRDLRYEVQSHTKKYMAVPSFEVPYRDKHTRTPTAFFMCDNANYLLGVCDAARDLNFTEIRYHKALELHTELLGNADFPEARSVALYFEKWDAANIDKVPGYSNNIEDILNATNIVFISAESGNCISDCERVRQIWDRHYKEEIEKDCLGRKMCSVTGNSKAAIARLHPNVTGVSGAQTTGACLVSFGSNLKLSSYNYFNNCQGMNAPTAVEVTEAYGNALKYLFKTSKHHVEIGSNHLLCWTDGERDEELSQLFLKTLLGDYFWLYRDEDDAEQPLAQPVKRMLRGQETTLSLVDADTALLESFYTLLIRSHSARLAITQFSVKPFAQALNNIARHYARTEIKSSSEHSENIRIGAGDMLISVSDKNGKRHLQQNAEEILIASVINDTQYPPMLLTAVLKRIFCEKDVSPWRVGVIKAFILQNGLIPEAKEVATVEINKESEYLPYILGCLFWEYENLQWQAIGSVNCSIKEKHLTSAACQPCKTFSILDSKAEKYLTKLSRMGCKNAVYSSSRIQELKEKIRSTIPAAFCAEEQGAFFLGYSHAKTETFRRIREAKSRNSTKAKTVHQ